MDLRTKTVQVDNERSFEPEWTVIDRSGRSESKYKSGRSKNVKVNGPKVLKWTVQEF